MTTIIGNHKLLRGDLTEGAVTELMGDELADVIYSDPPWGPGNLKYWHTACGTTPLTDWPGFLRCFCEAIARHRMGDAPVFVEMGVRWVNDLDQAMKAVGLLPERNPRRWNITYGAERRPNVLSLYGPVDHDIDLSENGHGPAVTSVVLRAVVKPGMLVLDPCTGKGMTARNTHKLQGHFRGVEMNEARLGETAEWLRSHVR